MQGEASRPTASPSVARSLRLSSWDLRKVGCPTCSAGGFAHTDAPVLETGIAPYACPLPA